MILGHAKKVFGFEPGDVTIVGLARYIFRIKDWQYASVLVVG